MPACRRKKRVFFPFYILFSKLLRSSNFILSYSKFSQRVAADGNENVKKTIGQQLCTCITLFCTFLSCFPANTTWNWMPNFAFYGGRKQATTKFYFSFWAWPWSLEIQLQEGSRTIDKVRNRVGIIAVKTEGTQSLYFLVSAPTHSISRYIHIQTYSKRGPTLFCKKVRKFPSPLPPRKNVPPLTEQS